MADDGAPVGTSELVSPGRSRPPRVVMAVVLVVVAVLALGGTTAWMLRRTTDEGTFNLSTAGKNQLQFRAVLIEAPLLPGSIPDSSAAAPGIAASSASPTDPSDVNWIDDRLARDFAELQSCPSGSASPPPPADKPTVACAADVKYVLGPAELSGSAVEDLAVVSQPGGEWNLELTFTDDGAKTLTTMTTRLAALSDARGQLAVVVGDRVLSAPRVMEPLTGATVQVAAGSTQAEATQLARKLAAGQP